MPIPILKQLYFDKPTPGGPTTAGAPTESAMSGITGFTPTAYTTPGQEPTAASVTQIAQSDGLGVDLAPAGDSAINKEEIIRLQQLELDAIKQAYYGKPEAWRGESTIAAQSIAGRNSQYGASVVPQSAAQSVVPLSPTSAGGQTNNWPYADVFKASQAYRSTRSSGAVTQEMAPVEDVKGGRKHRFTSLLAQDTALPTPPFKAQPAPTGAKFPPRQTIASISEFSYQPHIRKTGSVSQVPSIPANIKALNNAYQPSPSDKASTMNSAPPMPPIPIRTIVPQTQYGQMTNTDQDNYRKFREMTAQFNKSGTPQPQGGEGDNLSSPPSILKRGSQSSASSVTDKNISRIVSTPPPTIPELPVLAKQGLLQATQRTDSSQSGKFASGDYTSTSSTAPLRPKSGLSSNGSGPATFVRKSRRDDRSSNSSPMRNGRNSSSSERDDLLPRTTKARRNALPKISSRTSTGVPNGISEAISPTSSNFSQRSSVKMAEQEFEAAQQKLYQESVTLGRVAESMNPRDYLDTYSEQTESTNAQETSV